MNAAQKLLVALGVDPAMVMTDKSLKGYSPSFTKKGPGRKHKQGAGNDN